MNQRNKLNSPPLFLLSPSKLKLKLVGSFGAFDSCLASVDVDGPPKKDKPALRNPKKDKLCLKAKFL